MTLKGIIHDFQPRSLRDGVETHSVLMLPFGARYFLNPLLDAMADAGCERFVVIPAFDPDIAYIERLTAAAGNRELSIITPDERGEFLFNGETSESLLFVDPRLYPEDGYDFRPIMATHEEDLGAVFVTGSGRDIEEKDERVLLDSSGNVRKVQRVFDRMSWAQGDGMVVPFCVVPHMVALHGPGFPLSAMRARFASRGVPIRDLRSASPVAHLNRGEDMVRSASAKVAARSREDVAGLSRYPDYDDVWVAATASIAGSVRFVGEVIVNQDALIADEATIIGPTVIGQGAEIGQDATVAQSVVMDRAVVAPGSSVHQSVVVGRFGVAGAGEGDARRKPSAVYSDESFQVVEDGRATDSAAARRWRRTMAIKRAIDVTAAGLGLLVLTPLMLTVALLVKLTAGGPVFFTHRREGKDGREFGCHKFRTMRNNAHQLQKVLAKENESDGPQFVIREDPRVTRLGRILRKTNIDELPQLFNVLLGQMSLVGPRPSPFRENQVCAPWRRARLSVPPGITGLWQICRHDRQDGDFHQWIYFDTAYVRNVSIWLDFKILWFTAWTSGGSRSVSMNRVLGREADHAAWSGSVPLT